MPLFHTWFSGQLASCRIALAAAGFCISAEACADSVTYIDSSKVKVAGAVTYQDAKGTKFTLKPQEHKLTAVHFWATWCAPCVEELPAVDKAQQAYGAKGFEVIALSLDGDHSSEKVAKFLAEHGITHLQALTDLEQASFNSGKLQGVPTTLFIDAANKEIGRAEGELDWASPEVSRFIETHLK